MRGAVLSLDPFTAAMNLGRDVIERIWPDPSQRAEQMYKLEKLKADNNIAALEGHISLMIAQLQVNAKEAEHKSIFVSGWRPFIGWTCGITLFFNYIAIYLIELAMQFREGVTAPPPMDMTQLMPIILGMLGIAGMRSYEKKNKVHTNSIRKRA